MRGEAVRHWSPRAAELTHVSALAAREGEVVFAYLVKPLRANHVYLSF
ncbi:MAG: hypothetical protein LC740_15925 [Actinobacteria bacterium]|nr:hypothetical protein [Actinomycetota bacterium]